MAIIKQGILGGFSGRIAGVVGTSWKGRAIIKARPLSVANPKTAGQVEQRTSFKSISTLLSVLLVAIVRPLYNPIAGNISGANKFASQNKAAFNGSGTFVPENMKIGGGTLQHDAISAISTSNGGVTLDYDWVMPSSTPVSRQSDSVHAFAIEPISGNIWCSDGTALRDSESDNMLKFKAGSDLMGQLQVYGGNGFVSADGRLTSVESSLVVKTVDFGS